ncbi:tyrosine-type recombinase/integrase [Patescibacteria group bacterium]
MADSNSLIHLITDYLEYLEVERQVSQHTVRNYAHYLTRFSAWFEKRGYKDIKKLDLKMVRKYRVYLSRLTDEKGIPLSRVTQSYHVISLRGFLKWLIKNDYDVLAPDKIDLPKTESKSLKFLDQDQVERLLNAPSISTERGLRDKAILEMLFSTGLRVSELVSLNRDQINLKRREFGVIGKGKKARIVFLSSRAVEWIQKYFDMREDMWIPAFVRYTRTKAEPYDKGEEMRLSARSVQRIVEKYRKKAKLPVKITPHGLRHSFATDILSGGAGLREVQEMLGHKNISTTQIYTHVTNPQLRSVHEKYHSGNK